MTAPMTSGNMRKLLLHHKKVHRTYVCPITQVPVTVYHIPFDTDEEISNIHTFMRAAETALFKHYYNKNKNSYTTVTATDFWPGAILVRVAFHPPAYAQSAITP
jgi:hypothetical protein